MCFGGSAPTPAKIQSPAEQQDAGVVNARDNERRRRQLAAGSTNFTGPSGVPGPALLQTKQLLGQ